jgi:hypothetical protein
LEILKVVWKRIVMSRELRVNSKEVEKGDLDSDVDRRLKSDLKQ